MFERQQVPNDRLNSDLLSGISFEGGDGRTDGRTDGGDGDRRCVNIMITMITMNVHNRAPLLKLSARSDLIALSVAALVASQRCCA